MISFKPAIKTDELVSEGSSIKIAIIPSPTRQHVSTYIDDYNINEIGYNNCDIQYMIVLGGQSNNCVLFDIKGITTRHYYIYKGELCSYKIEDNQEPLTYFLRTYGKRLYAFNRRKSMNPDMNFTSDTIYINYPITCVNINNGRCRYIVYMGDIPVAKLWTHSKSKYPIYYPTVLSQNYCPCENKESLHSKKTQVCCESLVVWEECMTAIANDLKFL